MHIAKIHLLCDMTNIRPINVLSLFDGMSCGQIALRELGVKVGRYYASEIDRHAIARTQLNFPDTIRLGDVTKVRAKDLPKIDLLIGGSPCQGFSSAGKHLSFDDPRSKLLFEFVRILKECREINPGVKFLPENVRMKKEYEQVISDALGVKPVMINSSLVSAQNRVRLYRSNIRTAPDGLWEIKTDIPQPEDRGLYLRDILDDEVDPKYYLSEKRIRGLINHAEQQIAKGGGLGFAARPRGERDKMNCLHVGGAFKDDIIKIDRHGRMKRDRGKASCLTVGGHGCGNHSDMDVILQRPHGYNKGGVFNRAPSLTASSYEHNNIICISSNQAHATVSGGKQPYQQDRIYDDSGILPALCSAGAGNHPIIAKGMVVRRITPTEAARLQTIPEWYKWDCSEMQQYKMLGNGWTVEVIKHIFSFLNLET